eukprot:COSAG01_NODE_14662_length_1424_cov_0.885283_2_plen_288_part_00
MDLPLDIVEVQEPTMCVYDLFVHVPALCSIGTTSETVHTGSQQRGGDFDHTQTLDATADVTVMEAGPHIGGADESTGGGDPEIRVLEILGERQALRLQLSNARVVAVQDKDDGPMADEIQAQLRTTLESSQRWQDGQEGLHETLRRLERWRPRLELQGAAGHSVDIPGVRYLLERWDAELSRLHPHPAAANAEPPPPPPVPTVVKPPPPVPALLAQQLQQPAPTTAPDGSSGSSSRADHGPPDTEHAWDMRMARAQFPLRWWTEDLVDHQREWYRLHVIIIMIRTLD